MKAHDLLLVVAIGMSVFSLWLGGHTHNPAHPPITEPAVFVVDLYSGDRHIYHGRTTDFTVRYRGTEATHFIDLDTGVTVITTATYVFTVAPAAEVPTPAEADR